MCPNNETRQPTTNGCILVLDSSECSLVCSLNISMKSPTQRGFQLYSVASENQYQDACFFPEPTERFPWAVIFSNFQDSWKYVTPLRLTNIHKSYTDDACIALQTTDCHSDRTFFHSNQVLGQAMHHYLDPTFQKSDSHCIHALQHINVIGQHDSLIMKHMQVKLINHMTRNHLRSLWQNLSIDDHQVMMNMLWILRMILQNFQGS